MPIGAQDFGLFRVIREIRGSLRGSPMSIWATILFCKIREIRGLIRRSPS